VTLWMVLGTLGVVAAVIAAGVLVDRRFGILPRPRELREADKPGLKLPPHAPGEAPETALDEPPRAVRCRECRRTMRLEGESRATYGDRELVIRRYRCARCEATTAIYCMR
jgi:hypothetical protein